MTENNQEQVNELESVQSENDNYVIVKQGDKFIRKAKFKTYSSVSAETREEKIWLLNLYEGDEDSGNGLKANVGKQIEVENVITRPYDKINEETGNKEYGVLTYLITPEGQAFVTSSKSVYFSITRIMELFGHPHEEEWQNIKILVKSEKADKGDAIKIKMVG